MASARAATVRVMRARRLVPGLGLALALSLLVGAFALGAAGAATLPDPPATPQVLVVGDSLAVGTEPYLTDLLANRRVTFDAVMGRTTPQGLRALRERLQEVRPQTVVISLGTNDGSDPGRFASRIHRVLDAIPADACVVWSTVHRPPRKGEYLGLNRVLRRIADRDPRLTLVNWDHAVDRGAVELPDTVHPDPAGFLYRSRLFAHAVHEGCASQASPPGGAGA